MVESSATEGTRSSRHVKMLEEYSSANPMPPPDAPRDPRNQKGRQVLPRQVAGTKRLAEDGGDGERKRFRGMDSATVGSEAVLSGAARAALPSLGGTFRPDQHLRALPPSVTRLSDATAARNRVASTSGAYQSRNWAPLGGAVSGFWNPNRGLVPYSASRYRIFNIGAVLYCGHHVTTQNPHADPGKDRNFVQSSKFIICTKFRLGVVANVFENGDVFVLPSSTHEYKDPEKIARDSRKKYYMVLRDGDTARLDPTDNGPLDVIVYAGQRKIGLFSSICLTEGFTIKQNEEVEFVGRLTDESIERMLRNLATVEKEALEEYRDRKREDDQRIAARDKLVPKGSSGRPHAGSRA